MSAEIKVVPENSGLPERRFIPTGMPDFIGDPVVPVRERIDDRVYRIICTVCGLVDKASTPTEAETRGDVHLQQRHRSADILCGGCGHSVLNHHQGGDAPDIWPCDLCDCRTYVEDHS